MKVKKLLALSMAAVMMLSSLSLTGCSSSKDGCRDRGRSAGDHYRHLRFLTAECTDDRGAEPQHLRGKFKRTGCRERELF